ncbi:MAG: hypothetical protein AAF447_07790 [Myxococcota bacterium]
MRRLRRVRCLPLLALFVAGGCAGEVRADLSERALGRHELRGGLSGPVVVTLEAPAEAVLLQVRGRPDRRYGVRSWAGPGGVRVSATYLRGVPDADRRLLGPSGGPRTSPNPVTDGFGLAAALVPNAGSAPLGAGRHVVVLGATDAVGRPVDDEVEVRAFVRERPLSEGTLGLTIYLTGAGGLAGPAAAEGPFLTEAVAEFRRVFAQARLRLEPLRFVDVAARFQRIERIEGPGDLPALFAEAEPAPGLHVFLVERLGSSAVAAGASGGLPGPAFAPGSPTSGVAVALGLLRDPLRLGRAMAHESAHWLGLFHTSEGGLLADPLSDTPLGPGEADNLMFPALDGGTELTPEQGAVLRRHPEVRPP